MDDFKKDYNNTFQKAYPLMPKLCNRDKLEKQINKMSSCSQKIGFTFTFDKSYHNLDPDILYNYIKKYILEHLNGIEFIVATEFTKSGIMHFHGIIWNSYQRTVNKSFKEWRKTYGFVQLEYRISEKWEIYILKDIDISGYPTITNIINKP